MSGNNHQHVSIPQLDQIAAPTVAQSVDRVEQRQTFVEILDKISRNLSVLFTMLEWYGGPGIGKTTLGGRASHWFPRSGLEALAGKPA